jgi:hypothetical protein
MLRAHMELPHTLGPEFSVAEAARAGVGRGRLRATDLERPFHGVRRVQQADVPSSDPFQQRQQKTITLARAYAAWMRDTEFFSHETAALLWGAPLPRGDDERIHVAVHGSAALPRARGVAGHRTRQEVATVTAVDGLAVTTPASTWAMLGHLELFALVAVGDYFVRAWRPEGYFRVNPGVPSLTTPERLIAAVDAGRRVGAGQLRLALGLIREDSWSRNESITRCHLVTAGLPEPVLNRDYFDQYGEHLGCVDLSYPDFKTAIEYQGRQHARLNARDIERVERLRAQGWIVIQVTAPLLENPGELVRRVRAALISRGWRG